MKPSKSRITLGKPTRVDTSSSKQSKQTLVRQPRGRTLLFLPLSLSRLNRETIHSKRIYIHNIYMCVCIGGKRLWLLSRLDFLLSAPRSHSRSVQPSNFVPRHVEKNASAREEGKRQTLHERRKRERERDRSKRERVKKEDKTKDEGG